MNLTKNHVYNLMFWLLLFLFMGYKSINHTIKVHEEGVLSAYHDYKVQSQARISFLNLAKSTDTIRPPIYAKTRNFIKKINLETNPYLYVELNDDFTSFLDQNIHRFKFTEKEYKSLAQFQTYVKQESLIFNSHAMSFNSLISRIPYSLFSRSIPQIPVRNTSFVEGVIVER